MNPQSKARILYIDDLADWRETVGGLLRDNGYEVECFADAASVREAMGAQSKFNLAVLDMRLDERNEDNRDGLRLAFDLRDVFHCQFPIIILSAYEPNNHELRQLTRPPYRFIFLDKGFISAKDFRGLIPCIEAELPASVVVDMPYDNFDVLLSHTPGGVLAHVTDSPNGRCREIIPKHAILSNPSALFEVVVPSKGGQAGSPNLHNQIKEKWVSCLALARSNHRGLRLRIQTDDEDLRSIPWERLKVSGEWPALRNRTPIVRLVTSRRRASSITVTGKFKVLGLVGAALEGSGSPKLNLDEEKRLVEEALAPLFRAKKVAIDWLDGEQIINEMQMKIRTWQPHMVHYLGHGISDSSGHSNAILISNGRKSLRSMNAESLGDLLVDTSVQFVFLNACQTGHPIDGIAHDLVEAGIPAAIGMDGEISDSAAVEFTNVFYQAIADYLPVELAITEGRKRLKTALEDSDMQWASPILYMHADNGVLFKPNA